MKKYCDTCNEMENTYKEKITDQFDVRGVKVTAVINVIKCSKCHSEIYDKENEVQNDILVFDEYKKAKNLLTSIEIITIRKKYGLSQATLSRILGFGIKTITRYENGSIQDSTHDNLLRLLKNEANFFMLWNLNKHKLKDKENDKILKKNFQEVNPTFEYRIQENCNFTYQTDGYEGGTISER